MQDTSRPLNPYTQKLTRDTLIPPTGEQNDWEDGWSIIQSALCPGIPLRKLENAMYVIFITLNDRKAFILMSKR